MRHSVSVVASVLASWLLLSGTASGVYYGEQTRPEEAPTPTQLIVKYRPQTDPHNGARMSAATLSASSEIQALNQLYRVTGECKLLPENAFRVRGEGLDNVQLLTVEAGTDIEAAARDYENLDFVEYALPDYQVEFLDAPNDPYYEHQWALHNVGQGCYFVDRGPEPGDDTLGIQYGLAGADIDADEVFDNPPDNTFTVVVAIIDTGVDWDHPELVDRMWHNPGEIPDNGYDDDHNGYVDDVVGWDLSANDDDGVPIYTDNDPTDRYGHGTHCAGIVAAAIDNGIGISGTVPRAEIMALKFHPLSTVSASVEAIVYAVDNGADVISMSWGLEWPVRILEDALDYAWSRGVVCVASSGNSGDTSLYYPSSYDRVISVGATDPFGNLAYFSTFNDQLDLCAPGFHVLSLRAEGSDMYAKSGEPYVHIIDSLYYLASGTSMSAPHAAAVAAYMRSVSPGLSPSRVQELMQSTAVDFVDPYDSGWNLPGWDRYSGFGQVNLEAALAATGRVRAILNEPVRFDVVSGIVAVTGSADGSDFIDYVLEYGEGTSPTEWTVITNSYVPVTEGGLGIWNTEGLSGEYTLRLRVGEDNFEMRSVLVVDSALAEITSPSEGAVIFGATPITGSGLCPEFSFMILDYGEGTMPEVWTVLDTVYRPISNDTLGILSAAALELGVHTLRISVFSETGLEAQRSVTVTVESRFSGDYGWSYQSLNPLAVTANYGDFDGDGENEIVVGNESEILILDTEGNLKTAGMPVFPPDGYRTSAAVGRLDNDNIDDIVAIGQGGTLYLYSSQNGLLQVPGLTPPLQNTLVNSEASCALLFLKDMNNDGIDEIHYFGGGGANHVIYRADGSPLGCGTPTEFTDGKYFPADLNGDGYDEIYWLSESHGLTEIDTCGNIVTSIPMTIDGCTIAVFKASLQAVDLEDDGKLELVICGKFPDMPGSVTFRVLAFKEGLLPVPGWPHDTYIVASLASGKPVFADLDGDGSLEYLIAYNDYDHGYISAWNLDGTSHIGSVDSTGYFASSTSKGQFAGPVVVDLNSDGRPEVLSACVPDLFGTFLYERIEGFSGDGQVTEDYPISVDGGVYRCQMHVPVFGDVDRDGFLDMIYVAASTHRVLFTEFTEHRYYWNDSPSPMWRYNRRLNATLAAPVPWVCQGQVGNVNCDPEDVTDISDVQVLIDNQFITLRPLCCFEEADMDLSGSVDITDIQVLIDNQFLSLTPLPACP